ncbi:MAG: gliding motility-associated C-terminal domain-containing protein [Saprospiraceae bacterium]
MNGYFDGYNLDGVFTYRSLTTTPLLYFPFFQDTLWWPSPNPANGIPSPSDTILNAMTCDFSGNIFAAGRGISTYRPSTGALTYLGDLPPGLESAGGITHRNGEVFISTVSNSLARVDMQNPAGTVEVMQFPPGTPIVDGLITFPYRCDSLVTFAIARTDTGSIIYRLDFAPYSLTEICQVEVPIFAVAAREECIQPPCTFSLDLDRLDVSGAPEQDFRADTTCVTPMPIAAEFTEVRAAIPIDSIRLELTGILDAGQEYLALASANNLTVLGSGTPTLTLVSNGPATTFSNFEAALSAIRYHNDAPAPTYGQREVHSQAFAVFYRSLPATAVLPLGNENLRLNAAITPPSCFGDSDGSLLADAVGGIAPFGFQWAGGQSGPALNNLAAGAYPVTLTDALGCRNTDTAFVTQPELLQASITANTNFACGPEGVLTVAGTGGTLPYTAILWNDGNTEAVRDSMAAGSYAVALTDANGCTANTVFQLAGAPIVQVFPAHINFCKGETFLLNNVTYASDTTICETFTHELTGCDSISCIVLTFFDTVRVQEIRQICLGETTFFYGMFLSVDTTVCRVFETYLGCDSTRCLQVEVLRREGQMVASICQGETYLFGGNALSEAGEYRRTIPMPSGCDSTVLLTLTVLPAPILQLNTEGSFCNGGFVRISAGAFSAYQWSNGATTAFIEVQAPGIYSATVSDANGCTASSSIEIPADARIEFAYSATPPDCFGEASGALRVDTAYGGQSPYRYALNDGVLQTQPVFSNLSAGSYRLRVEDANGCGAEALIEIPSPPALFVDAGEDQVIRPGDTIQLQAIANLLPGQSLQWRPPLGLGCDTCAVTPAFPTETTLYEAALSDANGCTVRDEVWVRVDRRGGLYLPNAFSPNGDGINDRFFANTDTSVRRITSLRIFDRWGALVFERKDSSPNDPAAGWDGDVGGKPAMQGLYVYVINVERADGVAEQYSGEVVLVR